MPSELIQILSFTENEISKVIIGCAIDVHKQLGPGLLESAYQECLCFEIKEKGLQFYREKPMPIIYKDIKLDHGYRIDILVENKVIIEIKSVEKISNVHLKQLLTYIKVTDLKLGLLINFNEALIKNGIKRVVYGL